MKAKLIKKPSRTFTKKLGLSMYQHTAYVAGIKLALSNKTFRAYYDIYETIERLSSKMNGRPRGFLSAMVMVVIKEQLENHPHKEKKLEEFAFIRNIRHLTQIA